jgi:peptidoglycan/LPS O-acetylase OafA/YrhL
MSVREPELTTRPSGQLYALDLLRFAAAMLVLLYHYGSAFPRSASPVAARVLGGDPLSDHWSAVTWFGWIGVEIFFVISGFVIAHSAHGASRADFVRRRILRLVPAAWICASLTLGIIAIAGVVPGAALTAAWVRSMLFWPFGVQIDPVYWTLGIEIAFYAMIAATLGKQGNAVRIERLAQVIGIISTMFWLLVMGGAIDPQLPRFAQLLLLQHGCFFALGVTIWAILYRGHSPIRFAAFAVFCLVCLVETAGHAIERAHALGMTANVLIPQAVFAGAVAILCAAIVLQPLLTTVRIGSAAKTLGLMTYPLYLLHQDAGAVIIAALKRMGQSDDLARVMVTVVMLVMAFAIVRFAENPIRALIRRGTMRRAPG